MLAIQDRGVWLSGFYVTNSSLYDTKTDHAYPLTANFLANIIAIYMTLNLQGISENKLAKTIPASKVKNQFGAVVKRALKTQDGIVVESRGVPTVVIMPYRDYQNFLKLKENARRKQALAQWETLRKKVSARNKDLSEEQAQKIAVTFSRDLIERVVKKRKAKYG